MISITEAHATAAGFRMPSKTATGGGFADAMADAERSMDAPAPSADARKIAKLDDAITAFKKEASLTPAERARRDVLKAMDLTEDAIKTLPPKEREEVETKIAVEVARRLRIAETGKAKSAFAAGPPAFTSAP